MLGNTAAQRPGLAMRHSGTENDSISLYRRCLPVGRPPLGLLKIEAFARNVGTIASVHAGTVALVYNGRPRR